MINLEKILSKIESRTVKKHRWTFIPNTRIQYFYVHLLKHTGKTITLTDGTVINKGDCVGELHINNKNMPEITFKTLKMFSNGIDDELYLLAAAIKENPEYEKVKAFFGRTILFPLVRKKGFEAMAIRNIFLRVFVNFWDILLRKVYAKNPNQKNKGRKSLEIWISRATLLSKLGEV